MKYDKNAIIKTLNIMNKEYNGNMTYAQAHMTYKQCRAIDINQARFNRAYKHSKGDINEF